METQRLKPDGAFSALPTGTVLDRYRIDSVLAAGGFGITYICQHVALAKTYALKEHFPRQFAYREGNTSEVRPSDPGTFSWTLDRFLQEGRTLARCRHANVVGVADVFEANGTAYMVLDYVQGQSFRSWLDELKRPPTQAEIDRILAPILDALAYLHESSMLHRDIAPDNIIIRPDGTPCLIDFGAARQAVAERSELMSAVVKGGYSPPEQYTRSGKAQGPWCDIYALAATLYRAIAGKAPQEAPERQVDDELQPLAKLLAEREARKSDIQRLHDDPPDYRPAFLAAIDRALRLRHTERPQSIAEWRAELMRDGPETAFPPKPPPSPPIIPGAATAATTPRPRPSLLAAVLVVAAIGAGGWWWMSRLGPGAPPSPAAGTQTAANSPQRSAGASESATSTQPIVPSAQPAPQPAAQVPAAADEARPSAELARQRAASEAAEDARRVAEARAAERRAEEQRLAADARRRADEIERERVARSDTASAPPRNSRRPLLPRRQRHRHRRCLRRLQAVHPAARRDPRRQSPALRPWRHLRPRRSPPRSHPPCLRPHPLQAPRRLRFRPPRPSTSLTATTRSPSSAS